MRKQFVVVAHDAHPRSSMALHAPHRATSASRRDKVSRSLVALRQRLLAVFQKALGFVKLARQRRSLESCTVKTASLKVGKRAGYLVAHVLRTREHLAGAYAHISRAT